jgi:hypothetical protein
MTAVNQRRDTDRELWQQRFPSAGLRACFDRALRSVGEYNEKVGRIHLNPVRAGLVSRPEDWCNGSRFSPPPEALFVKLRPPWRDAIVIGPSVACCPAGWQRG